VISLVLRRVISIPPSDCLLAESYVFSFNSYLVLIYLLEKAGM
jgi:hypothetical protein